VTVAAGDERTGIDIVMRPARSNTVAGTVVNPAGDLPPLQLSLVADFQAPMGITAVASPMLAKAPAADGVFRYEGVIPGHYQIIARTVPNSAPGLARGAGAGIAITPPSTPGSTAGPMLWAIADINVSDADLSGVMLSLRPALHMTGTARFETAGPGPADVTSTRVQLAGAVTTGTPTVRNGTMLGRPPIPAVALQEDRSFDISRIIPGPYTFTATGYPQGWWLRSAIVNGRDILDTGLEIADAGSDITGAVVTFTDRHTGLTGALQTPSGTPATDYFVIVFTTDRTLWRPQARRLLSTRPASDGAYALKDLPPGEYYLAALTDLDPANWQTAAFLDTVVPAALRITIAEGEVKRQDLRLAQ
jgi:hypothetical protein